jgi:phosphate starvation-inducible PhoH-like protein
VDLPGGQRSGLAEVVDVLRGVEGIQFIQFDDRDVVRHHLVQKIVKAYERYNEAIGLNRQLSLKLSEPPIEAPAVETVAPAETPVA